MLKLFHATKNKKRNKFIDVAIRLVAVLAIGAGISSMIKAGLDSFYFENTAEAVNTAADAKYWAILGLFLIVLGIISLILIVRSDKNYRN